MRELAVGDVRAYYNLPEKVVYCTRCVTSNQRPRIEFDELGVCNACNYGDKKDHVIDWNDRERQLGDLLDRYRSKEGHYDVIVPASGGKDSSAVAHKLKHQYDMHPLSVTWAPHIYTDIGWKNLQAFIHSGFDNVLGTPNGEVHRHLTRLSFEALGDPFQPFIFGQMAFPFRTAVNYNVPLIFYGENGEAEYGGSTDNENKSGQPIEDFNRLYFSQLSLDAFAEFGITETDLQPYRFPSYAELSALGAQMHWFGYYQKWVPQENYYYAAEYVGFQSNPDGRSEGTYSKYSSLDDRIDGFHYYLSYIKFGMGRTTRDASQEVRAGHITRDEAIALVNKFDGEFPSLWFKDFLEYADITEERFTEVIDHFRPPHLWKKEKGEWTLRQPVV
jgi:N-acetyl sugar amidotransferase